MIKHPLRGATVALAAAALAAGATPAIDLDGAVDLEVYPGFQGAPLLHGVSAQPATSSPLVRHVCLVAPTIVALTVDARAVQHRPLEAYQPQPADRIRLHDAGAKVAPQWWAMSFLDTVAPPAARQAEAMNLWVFVDRESKPLGWRVGPERNWLWPVQLTVGQPLDCAWVDDPGHYRLSSADDPRLPGPVLPVGVSRKTKPHLKGATGPGYEGATGERHEIYLRFAQALTPGRRYRIEFAAPCPLSEAVEFTFDDRRLRTEAIHVNQAGFHPDQRKGAWVSVWTGGGGGVELAPEGGRFEIVEDESGAVVFSGRPVLRKTVAQPEFTSAKHGAEDYLRTAVWHLEFSALRQPGRYRVVVPGLGTSFPFAIDPGLWSAATRLQLMGFLNQRSGLALGPPHTAYRRPRNFHPADRHVTIHQVDRDKFFAFQPAPGQRDDNPFFRIEASLRPGSHDRTAWGSWADAADHDRRYSHLRVVHTMLDLYECNSAFFRRLTWSLPERDNSLPDLIDEALWGIELYRRSQRPDGEVIYGVESLRHPNRGEPSWLDTLPLAVVPGVPASATSFAGAAAQMARVLAVLDPSRSASYRESALRAWQWARAEQDHPRYAPRHRASASALALAATHLYRLTGESVYHDAAREALAQIFGVPPLAELVPDLELRVRRALLAQGRWLEVKHLCAYALLPEGLADARWQQSCRAAVIAAADLLLAGAEESALPLLRARGRTHAGWVVEAEGGELVVTAHRLTQDRRYLDALTESCQYGMGANPLNLSYTSGLGRRFARPMIMDAEYAQLGWPGGIATYGPSLFAPDALPANAWAWDQKRRESFRRQLAPADIVEWPGHELYFEGLGFPAINEFTIHQGMNDQLLRWAYLAQYFGGP